LVIVPAVAMGALVLALQDHVSGQVAAGAIAVALVPAPLVAPELVGRMRGGRMDQAGALVLGTAIASLLVVGSRGALASGALFAATEAFAISSMVANALPTIRDRLLVVLRLVGWAAALLIVLTIVLEGQPLFYSPAFLEPDPNIAFTNAVVALALLIVGAVSSAAVARVTGRDVRAAIGGAGLRDPFLAIALAAVTTTPSSAGVPLLYGVFCLGLAALALRLR
jgi:hypothetical protein